MTEQPGGTAFRLGGRRAHYVLVTCSLLYMVNYVDRWVLAAVLQPMKVALRLSDTQAGSLQTMFFLSMAAFSLLVAHLVDRWSRRKTVGVTPMRRAAWHHAARFDSTRAPGLARLK